MPTSLIVFADQQFAMEFTGVQRNFCVEMKFWYSKAIE